MRLPRPSRLPVAILLLLAGCSAAPDARPDGEALRILTDAAFPPFHYVAQDGSITGHDVELARLAAQRAGYRSSVHRVDEFADLFAGLEAGEFDLVAATSGITPERRDRFLFSRPYFTTCQAALVRAGGSGPRSLAGLRGARIGAAPSTTGERAARLLGAGEIVHFSTNRVGIPALERGEIDAYIADEFEVVELARTNPSVRVLPEPASLERYGFVMRLDEQALKRRIDSALERLEADGTAAALRKRFGLERDPDWPIDLDAKSD